MSETFRDRYGPWALVAGASEGIGAAFSAELARRGLDVVLVARRAEGLAEAAAGLPTASRTVAADLSTSEGLDAVAAATEGLEVGLVVANAAAAPVGGFLDADPADLTRVLDLNCRAPMLLARRYLPAMAARGRGGLVIMSSLFGQQGTALTVVYSATKAFGRVLAEGLWAELRQAGVDVVTCVPGAVATPLFLRVQGNRAPRGTVTPETVAQTALHGLGRRPVVVPGAMMRVASPFMSRVLPRRAAITAMSRATARAAAKLTASPTAGAPAR
jgi:uncharacterized protein